MRPDIDKDIDIMHGDQPRKMARIVTGMTHRIQEQRSVLAGHFRLGRLLVQ